MKVYTNIFNDFNFLLQDINLQYGCINIKETPAYIIIEISTGGWSDNETVLFKMEQKVKFDISDNGGHYVKTFGKAYLDDDALNGFKAQWDIKQTNRYKRSIVRE